MRRIALCLLLLGGCGEKIDAENETTCSSTEAVTFERQIKPLFAGLCTRCHTSALAGTARSGAPPNVNFDTYTAALASADRADSRVQNGTMPPSDPRPSAEQRQIVRCWIEQGKLER